MCASTRSGWSPRTRAGVLTAFLESFFARYVEYDFTADLEEQLDRISNNEMAWRELLRDFWRDFTAAVGDIKDLRVAQVIDALDEMLAPHLFPPRADGTDPRKCPNCGTGRLSLKLGKFGGFIGCSNYPECRYTRQLAAGRRRWRARRRHEEARRGSRDRPRSDAALGPVRPLRAARRSGRGREAQARRPAEGPGARRRRSRPRARAALAAARDRQASRDGEPIIAGIGRFGPYVQHGKTYANLDAGDDVLTVGLNRAVTLIAEKKRQGPAQGAASAPIPAARSATIRTRAARSWSRTAATAPM